MGSITYLLLKNVVCTPKALEAARLKRLALLLLQLPAHVIRRCRQLWVKIKWDHPMRLVFYRAMAALH